MIWQHLGDMIITGNFNHDYHNNQNIAHPYLIGCSTLSQVSAPKVAVFTCTCSMTTMTKAEFLKHGSTMVNVCAIGNTS